MKRLIITTTHGDEQFSLPVVRELKKQYEFDWIIGNPKATKKKTRFTKSDLNRCGPGNPKSLSYEERRAYAVIKKASRYNEVVDIHGTVSNTGLFIILSDPNWKNIELAKKIDVERVVFWPSLQPKGPLTQFIPNSLEIECGPKDKVETANELKRVLKLYLEDKPRKVKQRYYIVSGILKAKTKKQLVDFVSTSLNGITFTPLLVNQYKGITCYILQELGTTLEY